MTLIKYYLLIGVLIWIIDTIKLYVKGGQLFTPSADDDFKVVWYVDLIIKIIAIVLAIIETAIKWPYFVWNIWIKK